MSLIVYVTYRDITFPFEISVFFVLFFFGDRYLQPAVTSESSPAVSSELSLMTARLKYIDGILTKNK